MVWQRPPYVLLRAWEAGVAQECQLVMHVVNDPAATEHPLVSSYDQSWHAAFILVAHVLHNKSC